MDTITNLIPVFFVLIGAAGLAVGLFYVQKIINEIPLHQGKWKILRAVVGTFLVGFAVFFTLQLIFASHTMELFTSVFFMAGGLLVTIIAKIFYQSLQDIKNSSQLKNENIKLQHANQHDALTNLFNRPCFEKLFDKYLGQAKQNNSQALLLFIDIDHFKNINDTLGHQAGDYILKTIALVLNRRTRKTDMAARYGGDEFIVLLTEVNIEDSQQIIESFCDLIAQHNFQFNDNLLNVTCSVGATIVNGFTENAHEAIVKSDRACIIAKQKGRNCAQLSAIAS